MKFNASRVKVLIGTTAINNLEDCELSLEAEAIDVTTKDSNGWKEVLHGLKSWTISGGGILDFAATEGVEEIFDDLVAGTAGTIKFSTSVTGDSEFSGSGIYTSLSISAPKEDKVSFSFTITGTGVLSKTTIV